MQIKSAIPAVVAFVFVGVPVLAQTNGDVDTFDQDADQTLSSAITGNTSIVKSGNGTLTLVGANTYSNGTTVEAGTFEVASSGTLGAATGSVTINKDETTWLDFAGWKMDIMSRALRDPDDTIIVISYGEFRLLRVFVDHPRRIFTRDQLVDYSRGEETEHYDRAIDVQISRLRRKLSAGENRLELIRTVRSEGYMFVPSVKRS